VEFRRFCGEFAVGLAGRIIHTPNGFLQDFSCDENLLIVPAPDLLARNTKTWAEIHVLSVFLPGASDGI
jgi:hypothetical protein